MRVYTSIRSFIYAKFLEPISAVTLKQPRYNGAIYALSMELPSTKEGGAYAPPPVAARLPSLLLAVQGMCLGVSIHVYGNPLGETLSQPLARRNLVL